MGIEIERRFLVRGDAWRGGVTATHRLRQGYLAREDGVAVRVRVTDSAARLTIKGPGGLERPEFEYAIPAPDAEAMLARFCAGRSIAKTRHDVPCDGLVWEVDVFDGVLAGLVIAEVELPAVDHPLHLPAWAGREITGDARYANAALASASAPPRG
jgi:adenylate cyclase